MKLEGHVMIDGEFYSKDELKEMMKRRKEKFTIVSQRGYVAKAK